MGVQVEHSGGRVLISTSNDSISYSPSEARRLAADILSAAASADGEKEGVLCQACGAQADPEDYNVLAETQHCDGCRSGFCAACGTSLPDGRSSRYCTRCP